MTQVIRLNEIREVLPALDVVKIMEEGFAAYSRGQVVVPPVGEMIFEDPPGDVHLKYGYIKGDDYYVIKIASGFYQNTQLGLPTSNGLMLLFNQRTGQLQAVLLDEGHLTDVRTAAAGALAAKYLAPTDVSCIGIAGTGVQGRLQLQFLRQVCPCRKVLVYARSAESARAYVESFQDSDFEINTTLDSSELPRQCNLIVTATPSQTPLIGAVEPGTHITAVGSDTEEKIELSEQLVSSADIVVADSLMQSHTRGEVFRACQVGMLDRGRVVELGQVVEHAELARQNDRQITIADLTGVAVQDIQITKAVYQAHQRSQ